MKSKTEYQAAASARLKHLGLTNFKRKWDFMAKSGKQTAVRSGLAGVGIALGVLLTIANSKTFTQLVDGSDKQEGQQR